MQFISIWHGTSSVFSCNGGAAIDSSTKPLHHKNYSRQFQTTFQNSTLYTMSACLSVTHTSLVSMDVIININYLPLKLVAIFSCNFWEKSCHSF